MSKSLARVLRALARQGLDVKKHGLVYQVRQKNTPNAPAAEVLLPEDFKLEAKALLQLTNLASVRHPKGGGVRHCCATPDFHPGDSGIPIGSVVVTETENSIAIPAAVGADINCGMRLHHTDLDVDDFLARGRSPPAAASSRRPMGERDRSGRNSSGTPRLHQYA